MNRLTAGMCLAALASLGTQATAQTVVTLTPTADTYTEQGQPTVNFGTATTVLIRRDAAGTLTRGGYFQFDLSGLPTGTITSAVLRLYGSQDTGGTGITVKTHGGTATTPWGETALTYNNGATLSGVDFNSTSLATITVSPPPAAYYSWNVTSYVAGRRSAGHATIGVGYTSTDTYRSTFNSKEATTNRPQLVVTVGGSPPPPPPPPPPPNNQLVGSCPGTYVMTAGNGTKSNFPQNGVNRAFTLNLPTNLSTPRPVWVPLTGSVESTNENLDARGGNRAMTSEGFIVIGPVRRCAGQDPNGAGTSANGGACNASGTGGWNWNPWNEGRVFGTAGDPWKTNEGNDSRFLEAIVRCVAKTYPVDSRRIFVGGISSGGTMTNRALTFNSDFWAGGEPISGEWYMTQDNGNAYPGSNEFAARVAAVAASPTKIFQGRVGPYPLFNTLGNTTQLSPMIVITLWGGSTDLWPADGSLANYRPTTQAASNYFSAQANVVHVACSSHHGHQWPTYQRDAWNRWVLRTLASHPKGTAKSAFVLPALGGLSTDYSCRIGRYTDHY